MLGNIVEIIDNQVFINLNIDISNQTNLINLHVIFEDETKKIVGDVKEGERKCLQFLKN